jgi:hypothetical protein
MEGRAMSEAQVIWHAMETRRKAETSRRRTGILLAIGLLCAMLAAEAMFLKFVAGPDTVNMMMAAEGIAMPQ